MHLHQPGLSIDTLSAPEAPGWDESAFTALVEQFEPLVLSICYRITGNRADAEDAAQATFLALAQHLRARQRIDHLPAWVRGVARNCASHVSTAAARRAQHERQAAGQATRTHGAPEDAHRDGQTLLVTNLAAELRRLPHAQRRALELHYFEGQQLEAISAMLGVASGTVASWLSRGRSRLRKRLQLTDAALTWALALGMRWSATSPLPIDGRGVRHHPALVSGVAGLGLLAIVASACSLVAPASESHSTRLQMQGPTASLDPRAGRAARASDATRDVQLQCGYQMTLHLGPPLVGRGGLPDPAVTGIRPQPTGGGMTTSDGWPVGKGASASLTARIPSAVLRHPTLHLSRDPSAPPLTLESSDQLTISLPPAILAALLRANGGRVVFGTSPIAPSR